jgi:hypothetical protein
MLDDEGEDTTSGLFVAVQNCSSYTKAVWHDGTETLIPETSRELRSAKPRIW